MVILLPPSYITILAVQNLLKSTVGVVDMLALIFVAGFVVGFLLAWGIGRGQVEEAMRATLAIANETVFLLERFYDILEKLAEDKVDTSNKESDGGDGSVT
jgi:hypothetical protein